MFDFKRYSELTTDKAAAPEFYIFIRGAYKKRYINFRMRNTSANIM